MVQIIQKRYIKGDKLVFEHMFNKKIKRRAQKKNILINVKYKKKTRLKR